MAGSYAGVTVADTQAARHLVDAWLEERRESSMGHTASVVQLRGMVAQTLADAREAGYLEGVQRGRRDVAQLIHDALDGEGLSRGYSMPGDLL